jgi:hypothetical protein
MSKQYEPYKLYRAVLHLYPKSHREAFGQQMVQTLDDTLSDQQTKYGRLAVWLRLIFELPINIIEENLSSAGGISVNKLTRVTNRQYLYMVLALLVIGSYLIVGLVWRHERSEISNLNRQLQTVSANQFAMYGGNYTAATIIPSENAVYFPLAKLKLTATDLNEGLVYSYAAEHTIPGSKKIFPAELDISTHDLSINDFPTKQFDCSEVVYADFVTPSYPINPMWKSDGSINLADGRTMNVYYAPSIPGCENAWQMNNINSKTIADSLKQAVSY